MLTQASEFQTPLHQWRVGVKFLLMIITILGVTLTTNLGAQALILLAIAAFYRALGKPIFRAGLRGLKPLVYFIVFMIVFSGFRGEIEWGVMMSLRLINGFAIANLFTLTTRLGDLLSFLKRALRPLRIFGLNADALALSLALAMRFIPVLRQKSASLNQSWRARSTKRQNYKMVIPLVLLALDDAEQIGDALRARGGLSALDEPSAKDKENKRKR